MITKRRLVLALTLSLSIATIAIAGLLAAFLYRYVWETLNEVETIVMLKSEVAPVVLERGKIESVLQHIEDKTKNLLENKKIRDPF